MSDTETDDTDLDLREIRSKMGEAKWTLEQAARWEENAENARSYKNHAEELGIAIDQIQRYLNTGTERSE